MSRKKNCCLVLGVSVLVFVFGAILLVPAITEKACLREILEASCNDEFNGSCTDGGSCSYNFEMISFDCKIYCKSYYFKQTGECVRQEIPTKIDCGQMAH